MIVTDEKVLQRKSIAVNSIEEGQEIVRQLIEEVATHENSIGLAAPQIGIQKRVFITKINNNWVPWINPEILDMENETMFYNEGCLSSPGVSVLTNRPNQITVADIKGEKMVLTELESACFQHEFDHLDGVLFFDRRSTTSINQLSNKNPIGRNDLCPCGKVGKNNNRIKYKKCCGNKCEPIFSICYFVTKRVNG